MTDERRDDEIIGRALSRAIDTIDVNQTPYERSRIATAPARRSIFGPWQIATAAAAIVLALAIGSWLTRPTEGQPGVAATGTPVASPTISATGGPPTTPPQPTPTAAATAVDHNKIYLARPGLPPMAVPAAQFADTVVTANERIASRITALRAYRQSAAPPGLTNYLWSNSFQGGVAVVIAGDLAKVDLQLAQPFSAGDHAAALAILQQLVYTTTEEPGIRRVLLTENGGQQLTIGDVRIDKPLAREDVFGYSSIGPVGTDQGITWGGDDTTAHVGARLVSATSDGSRVVVKLEGRGPNGQVAKLPTFAAWLEQSDDLAITNGKYGLYVQLQWNGGGNSNGAADLTVYDQTPLRVVTTNGNNVFRIELDDARPWRAYLPSASELVIEIGGDPRAVSDRIAVTAPKPADVVLSGADLTLTGAARVFEANVVWRVLDSAGKVVANGHFNASLGSSAMWGTFNTQIPMPANVRGNLTLEVYEASPKDGSAQGVVDIPLGLAGR